MFKVQDFGLILHAWYAFCFFFLFVGVVGSFVLGGIRIWFVGCWACMRLKGFESSGVKVKVCR